MNMPLLIEAKVERFVANEGSGYVRLLVIDYHDPSQEVDKL